MKNIPVETEVGIIAGRNAIYLDTLDWNYRRAEVKFTGQFTASLCSGYQGDAYWLDYQLVFQGVISFKMVELDFDESETASSFDRVNDSSWLRKCKEWDDADKLTPAHQHYILTSYDDVFEFLASHFKLSVREARE